MQRSQNRHLQCLLIRPVAWTSKPLANESRLGLHLRVWPQLPFWGGCSVACEILARGKVSVEKAYAAELSEYLQGPRLIPGLSPVELIKETREHLAGEPPHSVLPESIAQLKAGGAEHLPALANLNRSSSVWI